MLNIIAHRGYWLKPEEKNRLVAFERAFNHGFGIETDIRDNDGDIVISHDMPTGSQVPLDRLLSMHVDNKCKTTLALNIKADGLQARLAEKIKAFKITNYFVFDMSVPDTRGYIQAGLAFYTRHSDVETDPSFYEESCGVWMDELTSPWISKIAVEKHLSCKKKTCLVSPELHGRNKNKAWSLYKTLSDCLSMQVEICTDTPVEANEFFNE